MWNSERVSSSVVLEAKRFLALLGVVCGSSSCAAATTAPAEPSAPSALGLAEGFSLQPQSVGEPADGLALRSVRHAAHAGYYRVVFDIGLQEGRPADVAPSASVAYRSRDKSLEITVHGIRHDLTGNLPLHAESGEPLGKPVPVDRAPVAWFARELVLDDSAVAYRIQLTREARFRLQALERPARIVVDVEDTGGARPR